MIRPQLPHCCKKLGSVVERLRNHNHVDQVRRLIDQRRGGVTSDRVGADLEQHASPRVATTRLNGLGSDCRYRRPGGDTGGHRDLGGVPRRRSGRGRSIGVGDGERHHARSIGRAAQVAVADAGRVECCGGVTLAIVGARGEQRGQGNGRVRERLSVGTGDLPGQRHGRAWVDVGVEPLVAR